MLVCCLAALLPCAHWRRICAKACAHLRKRKMANPNGERRCRMKPFPPSFSPSTRSPSFVCVCLSHCCLACLSWLACPCLLALACLVYGRRQGSLRTCMQACIRAHLHPCWCVWRYPLCVRIVVARFDLLHVCTMFWRDTRHAHLGAGGGANGGCWRDAGTAASGVQALMSKLHLVQDHLKSAPGSSP